MKNLEHVSTYYLMLELLNDGHVGLLPELEPLEKQEITTELIRRKGDGSDRTVEEWANWFIGDPKQGSELERANLLIFIQTRKEILQAVRKL